MTLQLTQIFLQERLRRKLHNAERVPPCLNRPHISEVVQRLQADRSDKFITVVQSQCRAAANFPVVRLWSIERVGRAKFSMRIRDGATLESVLWWSRDDLWHVYGGLNKVNVIGEVGWDRVLVTS